MNKKHAPPTIYGTGFIPLDVVIQKDSGLESLFAGGTCGNVMAIMAFLGWNSTPIARLEADAAGAIVREDLAGWGVKLDHIGVEPKSATPIVVEEIYRGRSGQAKHRYVWTCPECGGYLPAYRPILSKSVAAFENASAPNVFFFDRVSRAAVNLAKLFAEAGSVVVFEPSGSSDPRLFREAIRTCHILKYSSQRVRAFADLLDSSKALIEIETLGDEGLRYRTALPLCKGRGWKSLSSFHVDDVRDTAGCGDWSTSGMISKLALGGQPGLLAATPESLEGGLQFGQALSAWNCRFPAARGGMYVMGKSAVLKTAENIMAGATVKPRLGNPTKKRTQATLFCPSCTETSIPVHELPKHGIRRVV